MGLYVIPAKTWQRVREAVFQREGGICQNCGTEILMKKSDRTDRPTYIVHHVISRFKLLERARELSASPPKGKNYYEAVRETYIRLAIDIDNLELRCSRDECLGH